MLGMLTKSVVKLLPFSGFGLLSAWIYLRFMQQRPESGGLRCVCLLLFPGSGRVGGGGLADGVCMGLGFRVWEAKEEAAGYAMQGVLAMMGAATTQSHEPRNWETNCLVGCLPACLQGRSSRGVPLCFLLPPPSATAGGRGGGGAGQGVQGRRQRGCEGRERQHGGGRGAGGGGA
jgi:hypothetical protein